MKKTGLFLLMLILGLSLCNNIFAQTTVTLGEGTQANTTTGAPTPYGTWYKNFRQQYLVLATELNDIGGGPGNINSIAFHVQTLNTCSPMPNFRIRVKTTNFSALSTTFEAGTYTQVFQVAEFMPVQGWNIHTFSTPFNWDGASNLLIDIVTDIIPGDYTQNASVSYTPTTFNSALRYQSDTSPAIDGTSGTTSMFRANMQLNMAALDIMDLNALAIVGPTTPNVNSTAHYTIAVKNYSPSTVSTFTVKLMQVGGVELGSVPGTPILPQHTEAFFLPWTPTVEGETQLYGKVVMAGDQNPANDETNMLTVNVMEAGLLVVEVGNDITANTTTSTPTPYGTFYKSFRQQYLYTAADMYAAGAAPGLINAMAFNVAAINGCSPMPNYKIRVKHTDLSTLGTSFETGEYSQVFHAAEFLPTQGWNMHVFSTPFFWDGASNLLIDIVTDLIPGNYTENASVYHSATSYNSALRFQSDTVAGSTATNGTTAALRANARFFLIVDDMGSLSGTVTSGASPLADVLIEVENTVFSTMTAANGTYSLPHVPVGTQTVTASKLGYADVTYTVNIIENQNTIRNFALNLLPQVTVTGRIVGSDAPTVGISGAAITLNGYQSYSATTNATGQFSIPNVFANQSYTYSVSAVGYATTSGTVTVGNTNLNMGNVVVNEVAYPPHSVTAVETANYQSVNLNWQAPDPAGNGFPDDFEAYADFSTAFGDWTLVDVDQSDTYGFSGITFPNSGTAMSYIIFNPSTTVPPLEDTPAHSGSKFAASFASTTPPNNDWLITPQVMGGGQVRFWARSYVADYGLERFKVGVSTSGTAPANFTIISGASYIQAPVTWTEYVYDLSAYAGQQIHVGVQCLSDDAFIFFVDDFFVGDAMLRTASSSVTNTTSAPAFRDINAGRSIVPPNPVTIENPRNTDRALLGYRAYRLLAANQDNEASWTTLTPNTISPTQYTDNAWGPLPSGVYKYAVKAVYTNNVISPAAFSAELHKGMMGTLAGIVTESGTGTPVQGATITAGDYSGTTNASGAYSFPVYTGTYTVVATKPGYQTSTLDNIVINGNQTTTLNVSLMVITLPPSAVEAVEAYPNLFITWMAPGTADGEWLHYDNGENDDSIGTGGVADFDVAIRFPASALTDYIGMNLQAIKVWPMQSGQFSLRVWTGGTASAPGTMVVDQMFFPNLETYETVLLNNPVPITGTEELWFGYRCNVSTGYPAGVDAGPATDGFGNMIRFQGEWSTLLALAPSLNKNWNIQGYVGYSDPDRGGMIALNTRTNAHKSSADKAQTELSTSLNPRNSTTDRVLTGYKVWRLTAGQESNEATWTALTPNQISVTAYQDPGWISVPDGTYKWAVKAFYHGGAMSNSAFSNSIVKLTQIGNAAGFVRDEANQAIMGATVSSGIYSTTTNASGAFSLSLPAGVHSITASSPGYLDVTQSGVVIVTGLTTTVVFHLPISMVVLEDGFESYTDFALSFAPWTLIDIDQSSTYGLTGITFPNSGSAMAYMIFNPAATTPPMGDAAPHSGVKMAASFASSTLPNNDWLITPQVPGGGELKFWAKSYVADYGLERFKVGVSTTGTAPANFSIISSGSYVQAPIAWTEYTYDLAAYAGQNIHIGINCVSNDAFIFFVDDVTITGSETSAIQDIALASGWNLVSLNVSPTDNTLPAVVNNIATSLLQIKGTDGVYIPYNPYSSLTSLTDGKAYSIKVNSAATWSVTGNQIPANTPLPLASGWNMSAYLPQSAMLVATAMQSISPWLQQVKGQDGVYIPDNPYSSLSTMYPGKGYWIQINGAHQLVYPAGTSLANASATKGQKNIPEPTVLPQSMTLLARCDWADAGDILLAKVGDELRGAEELIDLEGFPAALLQIYCDDADEALSLWIMKQDGALIPVTNRISSMPQANLGHYPEFILLHEQAETPDSPALSNALVGSYPNPFNPSTTISFSIAEDDTPVSLNIYNLRGQRVSSLINDNYNKGLHKVVWNGTDYNGRIQGSGLYIVELKAGTYWRTAKLMLAK
jgi:hypothetical protein